MTEPFLNMIIEGKINSFAIHKVDQSLVVTIDDIEYIQNDNEWSGMFFERIFKLVRSDVRPITTQYYIKFLQQSNVVVDFSDISENCDGIVENVNFVHRGTVYTIEERQYNTLTVEDVKYLYSVNKTNDLFYISGVFK